MQDVNTALGGSNGGTAEEDCVLTERKGECVCLGVVAGNGHKTRLLFKA